MTDSIDTPEAIRRQINTAIGYALMHGEDPATAVLKVAEPWVRRKVAEELHQQAAAWHAKCAPYQSHYAIAWDDAVDFILAQDRPQPTEQPETGQDHG